MEEETRISTGSDFFDEMLGGGYESGVVTTIYGPPGAAKQTCASYA
jgi:RecA/RadA recombinase